VTYSSNRVTGHWRAHGKYIVRESASLQFDKTGFAAETTDVYIPLRLQEWQGAGDPRIWKLIISPEFGERLDLQRLTRDVMSRMLMQGPMAQAPLEDRFRLKVHEETRGEGRIYILSVAKDGPKMKTLQPGSCAPLDYQIHDPMPTNPCPYIRQRDGNMGFDAWMNMDSLATLLTIGTRDPQSPLDGPVINKTGLTDVYHVQLEYSPASQATDAPPALSIFTAVQKLGLKIEAGKGPRQFLVFDHAERPSEN